MTSTSMTTTDRTAAPRPARALVGLWVGVLLPPVSWMADFLGRYLMVRFANHHDLRWPFRVSTGLSLALLLLGMVLCRRALGRARQLMSQGAHDPGASPESAATLAAWGLAMGAFFLLLILAEAYPTFVLTAHEIA
jgi:hypothetical protein